jgi:hypothetical protein
MLRWPSALGLTVAAVQLVRGGETVASGVAAVLVVAVPLGVGAIVLAFDD